MQALGMFFIVTLMGISAMAARPMIVFKSESSDVMVRAGHPILVSDVASIENADLDVQERVLSLEVFESAPAAGEKRVVEGPILIRNIKDRIAQEAGLSELNWGYFSKGQMNLVGSLGLPEGRIKNQIRMALQRKCDPCVVNLKEVRFPHGFGQNFENYVLATEQINLSNSFLMPITVTTKGQSAQYYVTGQAQIQIPALYLRRSVLLGEKMSAEDIEVRLTPWSPQAGSWLAQDDLRGRVAARNLMLGRVLTQMDLKKEVLVQRGQVIRALVGGEAFEISAQVSAEDSGSMGDVIRIKNLETQKMMSGQVIDRGIVRIQ